VAEIADADIRPAELPTYLGVTAAELNAAFLAEHDASGYTECEDYDLEAANVRFDVFEVEVPPDPGVAIRNLSSVYDASLVCVAPDGTLFVNDDIDQTAGDYNAGLVLWGDPIADWTCAVGPSGCILASTHEPSEVSGRGDYHVTVTAE
jgi:hypothetical protein